MFDTCQAFSGDVEMKGGLYLFGSPLVSIVHTHVLYCINNVQNSSLNKDCKLWHMHFGHTSHDKLTEIKNKIPYVSIDFSSIPYVVCIYAK